MRGGKTAPLLSAPPLAGRFFWRDALFQIVDGVTVAKGRGTRPCHVEALVFVRAGKIEGDFTHLTGYVTARA